MTRCRVALAVMLALWAGIVVSCAPGPQDYHYPVCGGYGVYRSDATNVLVQYDGPPNPPPKPPVGIPTKVIGLAWSERYILARQQIGRDGWFDHRTYRFWVLDTAEHVRHGPLTEGEFEQLRGRLGLGGLELKHPKVYAPPVEL